MSSATNMNVKVKIESISSDSEEMPCKADALKELTSESTMVSVKTEQEELGEPIRNANFVMPVIIKVEGIQVKDENIVDNYKDNVAHEVCREEHLQIDVASKSVSGLAKCDTKDICSVRWNHEEQTDQGELEEAISSVGDVDPPVITKTEQVDIKDESSLSDYDDNITIEECCIEEQIELRNKSSRRTLNREETKLEETKGREVHVEVSPVRRSERLRERTHKHLDSTSTPHREDDEANIKDNIVTDGSVNGNVSSYVCDKCNKCFDNKMLLITHIHKHSSEKMNKCMNSLNNNVSLNTKCLIHEQNQYKCEFCTKCFSHKSILDRHSRIHTGNKPSKCDVNKIYFRVQSGFKRYTGTHTGSRPYKCDVCMKTFSQKYTLDVHYRIHTGEKPYKCNVCMKRFIRKNNMDAHLCIQNGIKPYNCDVCMKRFRLKNNLDLHIRIHTGHKPYQCEVCLKRFSRKNILDTHCRIHTGQKPYKCDVCLKSFSDNSSFKRHVRIHTGDKPYKCEVCSKTFSDISSLHRHISIHTGDKPYKCDICMKCFNRKEHLEAHIHRVNVHIHDKP